MLPRSGTFAVSDRMWAMHALRFAETLDVRVVPAGAIMRNLRIRKTPADGLVAGIGSVNGDLFDEKRARTVFVSYDDTVFAGTQGVRGHEKTDRMMELAIVADRHQVAKRARQLPGADDRLGVGRGGVERSRHGVTGRAPRTPERRNAGDVRDHRCARASE